MRALVFLACLLALPARANLIVLEPDDFAVGTNLSNIHDGVTLSWITTTYDRATGPTTSRSDVYAVACYATWCPPATGELGFGATYQLNDHYFCNEHPITSACLAGARVLEAVFESPVDYVALSYSYGSDPPAMLLYDTVGELIDYCFCLTNFVEGPTRTVVTEYTASEPRIARIVSGSNAGVGFVDRLVYRAPVNVPEPGTLALLAAGVLPLAWRRYRERSR